MRSVIVKSLNELAELLKVHACRKDKIVISKYMGGPWVRLDMEFNSPVNLSLIKKLTGRANLIAKLLERSKRVCAVIIEDSKITFILETKTLKDPLSCMLPLPLADETKLNQILYGN